MTEHRLGRKADIPSPTSIPVIPDLRRYLPTAALRKHATETSFSVYIYQQPISSLTEAYSNSPLGRILPRPRGIPDHIVDQAGIEYTNRNEVTLGISVGVFPLGTEAQNLQAYRDFENSTLTPLGIVHLRDHGEAVKGIHVTDRDDRQGIEIFAQPIPLLSETEVDSLNKHYKKSRKDLHPDIVSTINVENETRLDRQLLYPEIMKINTDRTFVDDSDFYEQVEQAFKNRLTNLNQGFVTLETDFSLVEVPQTTHPDLIQVGGKMYLPYLPNLYIVYQLEQAGFEVRLAEKTNTYSNPLPPLSTRFSIMIRPKAAAAG